MPGRLYRQHWTEIAVVLSINATIVYHERTGLIALGIPPVSCQKGDSLEGPPRLTVEDASESVQYVFLVSQITFAERLHLCIECVSIANTSLSLFFVALEEICFYYH